MHNQHLPYALHCSSTQHTAAAHCVLHLCNRRVQRAVVLVELPLKILSSSTTAAALLGLATLVALRRPS
jgi:hypothetical protein